MDFNEEGDEEEKEVLDYQPDVVPLTVEEFHDSSPTQVLGLTPFKLTPTNVLIILKNASRCYMKIRMSFDELEWKFRWIGLSVNLFKTLGNMVRLSLEKGISLGG